MQDEMGRLLRTIAEGTAPAIGAEFHRSLVKHLTEALEVSHAMIAEFADHGSRLRTVALHGPRGSMATDEYPLTGSVCEAVIREGQYLITERARERFPADRHLFELEAESYFGVACRCPTTGVHLGHLAVVDRKAMTPQSAWTDVFRIFAARTAAELMRARTERQLEDARTRFEVLASSNPLVPLASKSRSFQRVLEAIDRVAPTPSTVLLHGETGTGKELVARAIHAASPRATRPLISVNCAALPESLVESELFGHERGAFTGALRDRAGRFELADGGTLFLDEIGDLPLAAQAKVLRVLQEREVERVGGSRMIKVDVRIIAATHRSLERMVEEGRFRQDLFFRLNVFPIALPPLRDRAEDIPALVDTFLARANAKLGFELGPPAESCLERLATYRWPGNVRELENLVERAAILSRGGRLEIPEEMLPESELEVGPAPPIARIDPKFPTLIEQERQHILDALARTQNIIAGPKGAAQLLGINASTLRSRMRKLGIAGSR
jgi:formate hydrogenlyase transcriptional activator